MLYSRIIVERTLEIAGSNMGKFLFLLILALYSTEPVIAGEGAVSPYLISHRSDPVQWRELSLQVVDQARSENQLILLSSGYASCYWCYRMKEDTFSNPDLAEFINQTFVPILIDRDLEPDIDQFLQRYAELNRGFGGWPVSAVLTADGLPLVSFHYQKADTLKRNLQDLLSRWEENPHRLLRRAKNDRERIFSTQAVRPIPLNPSELLDEFLDQIQAAADEQFGGFGDSEKFPFVPQLTALLEINKRRPSPLLQRFLQTTLHAMLGSGFRDQLSGNFFRYTSDRRWIYPHFEKMLYTQALLGQLLLLAGDYLQQPLFLDAGVQTLEQMIKEFRMGDGLYRAALSATGKDGKPGSYYLWDRHQLRMVLGEQNAELVYNLYGNESDRILPFLLSRDPAIREKLLNQRQREIPASDDKAITAWNGLALSALASGAAYSQKLHDAAESLAEKLTEAVTARSLFRSLTDPNSGEPLLEDLVYLARGFCDWSKSLPDSDMSNEAAKICAGLIQSAAADYLTGDGWINSKHKPFIGTPVNPVVPDTQLPSPSAVWLDTLWWLETEQNSLVSAQVIQQAQSSNIQLSNKHRGNAFFHASMISALIRKNQSRDN